MLCASLLTSDFNIDLNISCCMDFERSRLIDWNEMKLISCGVNVIGTDDVYNPWTSWEKKRKTTAMHCCGLTHHKLVKVIKKALAFTKVLIRKKITTHGLIR